MPSCSSSCCGQGYPLTDEELHFQLLYLGDPARGYIEVKRLRLGRPQELEHLQVKATAKAVDLIDGRIPPDQGIAC